MASESETGAAEVVDPRKAPNVKDGKELQMRPSVASAVRGLRERMPSIRPNGIFRHPSDWTQEELDFIADALKQNVPVYTIANMVHCERHTLSQLIHSRPELKQLLEDKYENLLDEAEYQADRLMKAGNSSIVIYVLQTLGRKRGWAEGAEGSGDEKEGRIVMGVIPDEEVAKAAAETEQRKKETEGAEVKIDPMQMAMTEDMVKAEVDRRMNVTEAEGRVVPMRTEPKGSGESFVEQEERREYEEYGEMSGTRVSPPEQPDPWADGANSMFFQ